MERFLLTNSLCFRDCFYLCLCVLFVVTHSWLQCKLWRSAGCRREKEQEREWQRENEGQKEREGEWKGKRESGTERAVIIIIVSVIPETATIYQLWHLIEIVGCVCAVFPCHSWNDAGKFAYSKKIRWAHNDTPIWAGVINLLCKFRHFILA